jgi:hypothetical protein
MDVQFAEIPAQPFVRVDVQRLLAKEQNLMLRQRLVQLLDLTIAQRLRQRQPFDVGADSGCHRRHCDRFITHGARLSGIEKNRFASRPPERCGGRSQPGFGVSYLSAGS